MDWLTPAQRSRNMSAIRSRGNRTTEKAVRFRLVRAGICGWTLHSNGLLGKPDFVFEKQRVVVFVDGCYWHGCPACYRPPTTNESYWSQKLQRNTARDQLVTRLLRRNGWTVIRFWEHESEKGARRVVEKIKKVLDRR